MKLPWYLTFLLTVIIALAAVFLWPITSPQSPKVPEPLWRLRSVDTMKYSRDLAREKAKDTEYDLVIERQIMQIAETGATHVAVATPYEEEFFPFLARWVAAARRHNLHVWFRGNLAGWEGWFGYPRIGREEHTAQIVDYLSRHASLFQDGDLFTACPECENGGPGDPRSTGDVEGFRRFLIDERGAVLNVFNSLGKNVSVDIQSMNYDVAWLIMDPATTRELGGIVGIDHYVRDPSKLGRDIKLIAERSGGRVVLAEYGAPIPDIHGQLTEAEQAEWLRLVLEELSRLEAVEGLNYWVGVGGSTEIWREDGTPTQAAVILGKYYTMLK